MRQVMTKTTKCAHIVCLFLHVFLLGACSVSDGYQDTGIEGTGDKAGDLVAARGSVTRFGSIYVNGIHFNTDEAEFFINGEQRPEDSIKQGMVVYVEGSPGKSTTEALAKRVYFDYLLKGTIESIENISSNTRLITLLGYKVYLTEDAMMNEGAFDQLNSNDYIAVSGFFGSDNTISATRIDWPIEADESAVTGIVKSHSNAESAFTIAEQPINYSNASFNGGSQSDISNGTQVRVVGRLSPETNVLEASTIHIIREKAHEKYTSSEEGLITNFVSESDFDVNGIDIDGNLATLTGDVKQRLENGSRVTVNGHIDSNRVFVAETIYLHYRSSSRISGAVTNIDTHLDTITVSGIEFHLGSHTNYEDLSPSKNRYFGLDDVRVGDQIDVFSEVADEDYIGVTLRRKPSESASVQIKGRISSIVSETQFNIFGIQVDASGIDSAILSQLNLEDSVFVIGEYTAGSTFRAKDIFILENKCTSHKKEYCEKQTPSFWFDESPETWNEDTKKEPDFNDDSDFKSQDERRPDLGKP